jgi:SAM-dependent methyltransferase
VELLALPPDARVLDLACGKAYLLERIARRWGCRGVGVDLCPPFVEAARGRLAAAGLADAVEIVEGDASRHPAPGDSRPGFDMVSCLGASWIFGGHEGTLRALAERATPEGLVVTGEPYWRRDPTPAYAEASGLVAEAFGTHRANVETGLRLGLVLLHTFVSSAHDFDRYEGLQWNAIERFARENPGDPDTPALVERLRRGRDAYLRWGREELGWALYVFAKGPAHGS